MITCNCNWCATKTKYEVLAKICQKSLFVFHLSQVHLGFILGCTCTSCTPLNKDVSKCTLISSWGVHLHLLHPPWIRAWRERESSAYCLAQAIFINQYLLNILENACVALSFIAMSSVKGYSSIFMLLSYWRKFCHFHMYRACVNGLHDTRQRQGFSKYFSQNKVLNCTIIHKILAQIFENLDPYSYIQFSNHPIVTKNFREKRVIWVALKTILSAAVFV